MPRLNAPDEIEVHGSRHLHHAAGNRIGVFQVSLRVHRFAPILFGDFLCAVFRSPGSAYVVSSRVPALSAAGPRIMLRGGLSSTTKMNADLKGTVKKLIDDNAVMVFSKTHCPYCAKVCNDFVIDIVSA